MDKKNVWAKLGVNKGSGFCGRKKHYRLRKNESRFSNYQLISILRFRKVAYAHCILAIDKTKFKPSLKFNAAILNGDASIK